MGIGTPFNPVIASLLHCCIAYLYNVPIIMLLPDKCCPSDRIVVYDYDDYDMDIFEGSM